MDTRETIMNAALELFSTKGYAAVRTKEIAKLAKVNETTLFRHFKSKRALYESIIVLNIQKIDPNEIFHKGPIGDLEVDLMAIATQLFMVYRANAQLIKMIMKGIINEGDSLEQYASECRGGHIKQYLVQYLSDLAAKGQLEGDPILFAELFMSCLNGYLLTAFILEDKEADLAYFKLMAQKLIRIIK